MANIKISQLPAAGSSLGTDEFAINQGGISKKVTPNQIAAYIGSLSPIPTAAETVYVAKYGDDTFGNGSGAAPYLTVAKAISVISDNSSSKPYVILIFPGVYTETQLVMKPYVSLTGISDRGTVLNASVTTQPFIIAADYSAISGIRIGGATGSGGIGVKYTGGSTNGSFFLKDCIFNDCETLVYCQGNATFETTFVIQNCITMTNIQFTTGFRIDSTSGIRSRFILSGLFINTGHSVALPTDYVFADGDAAKVFLSDSFIIGSFATPSGNGMHLADGADVTAVGSNFINMDKCIWIENTGADSNIAVVGIHTDSNNNDIVIDQATATGSIEGAFMANNSSIASPLVSVSLADPTGGIVQTGALVLGSTFSNRTDVTKLILEGPTMGLYSGGALSSGGGLVIDVAAGTGYFSLGGSADEYFTWNASTISVSASSSNYIYFNNAGTLTANPNFPDTEIVILLGRVVTNATTLEFIDASPLQSDHYGNSNDNFIRNALGAIYQFGSLITENATPKHLNVTNGSYFFSDNNFLPSSGTNITFHTFYSNGSGGQTIGSTNVIDTGFYDNGSGTLQAIPGTQFANHSLYLVGDGANQKYMMVYAQATYATLNLAQNAAIPTPPAYFTDGVVLLGSIIVLSGAASIVAAGGQIVDRRPRIGFASPSVASTGTVSSVGLSLPVIFTVTGSPVTTVGTLTGTLASQSQNLVFASPNGSSGTPTFRSLLAADLPSLTGTYANLALSNLASTAVNVDINPGVSNSLNLGSTSFRWASINATTMVSGNQEANVARNQTTPSGVTNVGALYTVFQNARIGMFTGNDAAADSVQTGNVFIESGNKTGGTGNSGNINIQTGTSVGGTRGSILINGNMVSTSADGTTVLDAGPGILKYNGIVTVDWTGNSLNRSTGNNFLDWENGLIYASDGATQMLGLNTAGSINASTNKIINVVDCTSPQDAATKNYVDNIASQLNPLQAAQAASTATVAGTYINGASGIGATFTTTSLATFTLDGYTPTINQRVLLKNQTSGFQNGVYTITQLATGVLPAILTRALDYDTASDMNAGDLIPIINGTVNAQTSWLQTATITTVGTDALTFIQWTAAIGSYLLKTNNLSDVSSVSSAFANIVLTNTVTNTKLSQMPTLTIKGNNTGGTANALDLTVAQVNTILPVFTSTLNGLVPLSGGGTTNFLRADGAWAVAGTGSVTSVSVVSANGFAGTVATATTTPAITITTSITGVLKGNGTAISAATSGTDYSFGTSALTTGILKSTTTTGALTIAVAGDFPTLNQNTTGTALNVTGIVAIANGGTNASTNTAARVNLNIDQRTSVNNTNYTILSTDRYVAQTGTMSASRTFTLPAASSVNAGQTVIIADESGSLSLTNSIVVTRAGSDTVNGATTATLITPFAMAIYISNGSNAWTFDVQGIPRGGTGATTASAAFNNLSPMTTGGDLIYGGASGVGTRLANGTLGQILQAQGGTSAPQWSSILLPNTNFFASSQVTTNSSGIASLTFTTFSNSPAFTFTPTSTGTWKIYSGASLFSGVANAIAKVRVFNTSGSGTLLQESQGSSYAGSSTLSVATFCQSVYTLTAGTTYVFDLQGAYDAAGAVGNTFLQGGICPFYMFAELCSSVGSNGFAVNSISSNTTAGIGNTYLCDTSGGAFNLTLPTPVINGFVTIKDSTGNFNTNNLTVVRHASEKIENVAASKALQTNFGAYTFLSNGTDWFMV